MRKNRFILSLLLATTLALTAEGRAADRPRGGDASRSGERQRATTVRGILIIASNEPGRADPRLADYEGVLQRVLRFRSFRFVAENSVTVPAGGRATLNVQGQRVELQGQEDGSVSASRGGITSPTSPATVFVAGSAGPNGEVYGLIVLAQ